MGTVEKDPLEAALATAFSESPILIKDHVSALESGPSESTADSIPASETQNSGDDSWKEEYDKLSASWHAESARAREKAERERERWRVIREQEEAEAKLRQSNRKESEWENVTSSSTEYQFPLKSVQVRSRPGSPSPADVRDLVTGEHSRSHDLGLQSLLPHPGPQTLHQPDATAASIPPSNPDDNALSGSRAWEDFPSVDSSFPSFSLREPSSNGSLEYRAQPSYQQPLPPPSVTLAIFDRSLSRRTRFYAFLSSLSINLLLPFINGIMLGFGEIFAKNVIMYFGWQLPGVAGVGIRMGTGLNKAGDRPGR